MVPKSLIVLVIAILVAWFLLRRPTALSEEELRSNLAGKVVLLCGASSGIGEQITYDLARVGAKVVITARRLEKLEAVKAKAIEMYPGAEIGVLRCDFSDVSQAEGVVGEAIKVFGHIDHVMINHAIIMFGPFLSIPGDRDPATIENIFQVNMFSYIQIVLAALPHLEERSGHIIVTSSIGGEGPSVSTPIYAATKHAMNGFFYSISQELTIKKSNTSITVAALGLILTDELIQYIDMGFLAHAPEFSRGSLTECSMEMVESLVTRPGTLSYPYWSGVLRRMMWQFAPDAMISEKSYEAGMKIYHFNKNK